MAITITFYMGQGGGTWTDVSTDSLIFSGDADNLATGVEIDSFQDGTHLGDGVPGADQCAGGTHGTNVKYASPTTMILNSYEEEEINDINLTANDCTLKINLADAAPFAVSDARLYVSSGYDVTSYAKGIDVYGFERGAGGAVWVPMNISATGMGGDYDDNRLDLLDKTSATSHDWYVALSASPKIIGGISELEFGFTAITS